MRCRGEQVPAVQVLVRPWLECLNLCLPVLPGWMPDLPSGRMEDGQWHTSKRKRDTDEGGRRGREAAEAASAREGGRRAA